MECGTATAGLLPQVVIGWQAERGDPCPVGCMAAADIGRRRCRDSPPRADAQRDQPVRLVKLEILRR